MSIEGSIRQDALQIAGRLKDQAARLQEQYLEAQKRVNDVKARLDFCGGTLFQKTMEFCAAICGPTFP